MNIIPLDKPFNGSHIFVTGDLHGETDIFRLSTDGFSLGKTLTRNDFVIVCGDAGIVWDGKKTDKFLCDWLENKPWTTLFVDGNHENFEMLNNLPEEKWHGGSVHIVRPHVLHLMRGQIFEIGGYSFFTMGGADSHDKAMRKEGKNWWKEELPDSRERATGLMNLSKFGNEVDFIISHCAPTYIQDRFTVGFSKNSLTMYFDDIARSVDFEKWFFGHYHRSQQINDKFHVLYYDMIQIC